MDPRDNPYTPNAGAKPPALVGRDAEMAAFEVLLSRLERGSPQQSMIMTGLRGVGKTVLLGALREIAAARHWAAIDDEMSKNTPFATRAALGCRRALLGLSPRHAWKARMLRAAGVLKSLSITYSVDSSITAGFDVDATRGTADSGLLAEDLSALFVALGEAAQEAGAGVVFLYDEIQYLKQAELEALIQALHMTVQRSLPLTLVGAGLPQIPRLAGEAKSYSERIFTFPVIGPLGAAAESALTLPAERLGVTYEAGAAAHVIAYTEGYAYFIQEYGSIVWDTAADTVITLEDVQRGQVLMETKLDANFFRVRAERATPRELEYMRAMAELGPDPHSAGEVAHLLGRETVQLGATRSRLIEKGLLYAPTYGLAAFTVPQFDRYMKRDHPFPSGATGD